MARIGRSYPVSTYRPTVGRALVATSITGSDSGSGADVAGTVIVTDGTGESVVAVDSAAVSAQIPVSDTFSGADAASMAPFGAADTGIGTESASITAQVPDSDFGGGIEAYPVAGNFNSAPGLFRPGLAEPGLGIVRYATVSVTPVPQEGSTGADSAAVAAQIPVSDTFSGSEAAIAALVVFASDSGSFVESLAPILVGNGDFGSVVDNSALFALIGASEAGNFAEAATFSGISPNDRIITIEREPRLFQIDGDGEINI